MQGGLAIVVTRRGRKRKPGPRNRNGDLIDKRPDDKQLASRQPHRRDLPEKLRLSEKATTVLGKINLFGRITDEQYEAGRRYAAGVNAYRAVICSSDPLMAPSPGFTKQISPEEAQRRKDAYNSAFELLDSLGNRVVRTVNRAVVYDDPSYGMLSDLSRGLDALVQHYGLTHTKKGVYGK